MVKDTREVKDFDRVALRGYGELFIQQGLEESLEIQADEEYLPNIKTSISGGKLKIDVVEDWIERITAFFSRGFESQRIRFYLTVKELKELDVSGAARVEVNGLQTESFRLQLSGAAEIVVNSLDVNKLMVNFPGTGSIQISGKAIDQEVQVGGAGAYRARKLESHNARIKLSGVGKATVWVLEELTASVSGMGAIDYYGSPKVSQSVGGLGTINAKGAGRFDQ